MCEVPTSVSATRRLEEPRIEDPLSETLENLDQAGNYAAWIAAVIAPYLGDILLEVGAGHGTLTAWLAQRGKRVVASELSDQCVRVLQERFSGVPNVVVVRGDIAATADLGPFDTVVMINVLEHIEDDARALAELRELLVPGGRLVIWTPAFPLLYSRFDNFIGHHRRYRRASLGQKLVEAGFEPQEIRYYNALGGLVWLVFARLLRRIPTRRAPVRWFDRYCVPLLRRFERRHRVPFGQSVFAVAARGRSG